MPDPQSRALQARLAAHHKWAKTDNATDATQPARDKFMARSSAGSALMSEPTPSLRSKQGETPYDGAESGKQSIGDMITGVTDRVMRLLRQEVQLAKLEIRDDATAAAKAGGMLGGAGVSAHRALAFVTLTAMFAWTK